YTKVTELRRPSIHAALSGFLYPLAPNEPGKHRINLNFRVGARGGVVFAGYEDNQTPTADLATVEMIHAAERRPDGTPEHDPATFQTRNIPDKDPKAFFGLF